ncbi:MAG: DNA repair protein RecN [Candidatus Nanopelagicales bacterium]
MITELRIRGLGVIADAVVPFAPGLTVVTGETGAGKTMVLTGLGLVSGERADPGLVRTGSERADVDAEWRLGPATLRTLASRLEDAGVDLEAEGDDQVLLLGRTVAAGGRSRAFAGGRSVPATVLAELSTTLLTVHGQADQLSLRDPRRQRDLLDAFAGAGPDKDRFAEAFARWRSAGAALRDLVDHRAEREREAALLRHGIAEIAAVAPVEGEDDELKARANALAHSTDLMAELAGAHASLIGDDGDAPSAVGLLALARRAVDHARALDPRLDAVAERLASLADGLAAAAAEIADHARDVDADPAELARVEERRHAVAELKRRYGPELADVLAWWAQANQTVSQTDDADARIDALRHELAAAAEETRAAAAALTSVRREGAARLGTAVTAELRDLAMPDARLDVDVVTVADLDAFTADGADTVTLLLSPHSGADPRPLDRGASGGELSRVMLAVEVVLAGDASVGTFVFDEVDAGIGGKVAVEVGRRLARLARSSQVVVVTHLPQVAAFADRHVVVTKGADGQVTATSVNVVDGPDRVRELVRMLSGLEDSQSGAEHATELLELASADKAQTPARRPAARRGGTARAKR